MFNLGIADDVLITPKDGPALDAFGRWRVSQNHILFSGQLNYADNPLIWDTEFVAGGTAPYSADESAVTLTVPTTAGAEVVRQTRRHFLYRAGQSQLIRATFADADPVSDLRKRVGYFNEEDGIFFEVNGTTDLAFVRRSSVSGTAVDNRKVRADWNLDKLDGTGPSGVTFDLSKSQQFVCDLQWLGTGRVRVGFVLGPGPGVLYAHEFDFSNEITGVAYMKTGSLPVRYELTNLAAASGTFVQICAAVVREGGAEEEGIPTSIRSPLAGGTRLTATTTPRSAVAVRLTGSHVRAFLKPRLIGLMNFGTTAQHVAWDLVLNPTLAGSPTFTSEGPASEAAKILAQQKDYTVGSGHVIASGIVPGGTNQSPDPIETLAFDSLLGVAASIAKVSDVLVLVVESAVGSPNIAVIVGVLELF